MIEKVWSSFCKQAVDNVLGVFLQRFNLGLECIQIVFVARFFTAVCQVECSHVEIQIGIL